MVMLDKPSTEALRAAWFIKLCKSAPLNPVVPLAKIFKSTLGSNLVFFGVHF